MKPTADLTRGELELEVAELRAILYGSPRDDQIHTLRARLKISPNEARILLLLNRCAGRVVPKWKIDEEMPPTLVEERSTQTNNVAVYVSRLRKRLGHDVIEREGDEWHLVGYRLTCVGRRAVADALA